MDLNAPFAQLERADLIRRTKEHDAAYQFKYALIQESAYASLLRTDRRNLHRDCARAGFAGAYGNTELAAQLIDNSNRHRTKT